MTSEIQEHIDACNEALTNAIDSQEQEEWRLWRSLRNQASKYIHKIKGEYMSNVLNNTKTLWKAIKLVTNEDNSTLPRRIIVGGKFITSSKEIAQQCILFFKDKIERTLGKVTLIRCYSSDS